MNILTFKEQVVLGCGADSKDWYAWVSSIPAPDRLSVSGWIEVATPGVKAILTPRMPESIHPNIVYLNLFLIQQPGNWPESITWSEAVFDKVLNEETIDQIHIFCNEELIVKIPVVQLHGEMLSLDLGEEF